MTTFLTGLNCLHCWKETIMLHKILTCKSSCKLTHNQYMQQLKLGYVMRVIKCHHKEEEAGLITSVL